jgi:hypothetical protein
MIHVDLHPGPGGRRYAVLRELTGAEELGFAADEAFAGTTLVDRLLVRATGASVGPGEADLLAVADRDRLLAALYRTCFGDRIESVCCCAACGERFELGFLVSDIEARPTEGSPAMDGPDAEGFFTLRGGGRFRLPTVADLKAVAGFTDHEALATLRRRCIEDAQGTDADAIDAAMEHAGPLLSCDLEAQCPQCGGNAIIRFDLERHLLAALAAERRYLTREIHVLASAYHWSLSEITSLRRDDRRALVRCVEAGRRVGEPA